MRALLSLALQLVQPECQNWTEYPVRLLLAQSGHLHLTTFILREELAKNFHFLINS